MSELVVESGTVLTLGEQARVLPDHDVLCRDGVVAAIAPHGRLHAPNARRLAAGGRLVMPGFINAHTHCYSTFARGLTGLPPAADFPQVLEHLWWRLDRALNLDDCYLSALVAGLEAVRHGTTTLIDHHASPGAVEGSLDAIARAVDEVGVRTCLCYEVSDRDGEQVAAAGLAETRSFLRRLRVEPHSRLAGMVGLHASFTLSDATVERAVALAREAGVGVHVHVAEALCDQQACLVEHGCRVVERFHRLGVLGPASLAAHCVHVDEHELELLAASGTAVVHNPQSNMNNAVGVADVPAMVRRGVVVGLGTDAMTPRMLEEARAALWVRHLAAGNPSAAFAETATLLTDGNRRLADRIWPGAGMGELRAGGVADLILVDYRPPTPLHADNLLGHLIFGVAHARVDSTVVGGRVLMEAGRFCLDLDEEEVAARARRAAEGLWRRL